MPFGLSSNQEVELARARADAKTARARLVDAQRAFEGAPRSDNVAAKQARDNAAAALSRAEARVSAAEANMR